MSRLFISIIVFLCFFLFHSCEKTEYVDRYVYQLDTLYLPASDKYKGYETVVISKQNGHYYNLKDAALSLNEGKYILYLPDSLYEESVDCNLDIKEGWILKGRGVDKTKIIFRAVSSSTHLFNLNIIGSSEVRDLSLLSITTDLKSRYCIHLDDNRAPNLKFLCENVYMEGRWEGNDPFNNNGNMLVLGIGTWDNWKIYFKNCIIKGDERIESYENGFGVINLHNNDCDYPGKIVFDNCKIISNGNAVLIRDYRFKFDNANRMKDTISFVNTEIQGYLVGYAEHEARNGYYFNVSNSSVSGILDSYYLADCNYASYSFHSLPAFNNVCYIQNLTGRDLIPGTLVKVKNEQKEYYWNTETTAPLVVGFEIGETEADGILLSGAMKDKSVHVLFEGIGRIGETYVCECREGDYVTINGNKLISSQDRTNMIYLGGRYFKIN